MEILRQINEAKGFVIEWLDDTHVLCKPSVYDFLEEEVTRRLEMAERQRAEFGREVRAASSGTVWQETGGEGVAGGEEGEEGDAVFGYYEEMQQTMTTEFEEFAE
eukprot:GHVS01046614.1.p1 GENE.GHVS01046614.1~~GHVS01046614.1.p1  ORF type:complete len:105 (-),score=30.52 GHVS01046614.1:123-437(-)